MPHSIVYLIDGTGLCYSAYYALSGLSTSYGQPTGAVFGFIHILNKILKEKPEYLACCLDVSRETFRQKMYKEYKIHRPPMPESLASQMQFIKEALSAYHIVISELEGYEADDLIASFAKKAKEKSLEVMAVSSDKDILQLVDDTVKIFDPKKEKEGLLYDKAQVKRTYGIEPDQIVDYFSLIGDAADNIAGVKGIGEKTARSLLVEFGSVENIITHLEKVKSQSIRQALQKNISQIRLNRDLLKLNDSLEVDFNLQTLRSREPDYDKLYLLFKKLEFNSLLKKLPPACDTLVPSQVQSPQERLENDARMKERVFGEIRKKKELFFILDARAAGRIYISCNNDIYPAPPGWGGVYSITTDDKELYSLLIDPDIKKISHNLKEGAIVLLKNNIALQGLSFDTMLAAYVLDSSVPEFSLSELAYRYFQQRCIEERLSPEDKLRIVLRLTPFLKEKLKENSQSTLFYELEMPLVRVLALMQLHGVKIDTDALAALSKELEKRLINLRSEIYCLNEGKEFNLNSPKQLADVLFERLRLPPVKKTKTGFSTDEEVLRKLSKAHTIPLLILEYRNIAKLKSTYVDSLPSLIDPQTKRIHAVFDQAGTETGRLASHDPNLQNIPVRGDIANLIRKAFIVEKGHHLVCADYSQIELRVLAHLSADEALISAFKKGLDIHRHSAGLIFEVSEDLVSNEMRETAKRINFGIVYGMGSFGLSKDLDITQDEAQAFIDGYFLRYPGVKQYIDEQIRAVKTLGYAQTLLGRRRYLPGINNKNNGLRSFAERQAVNSPIQGTAADLIKLAMVNLHKILEERRLSSKIIMQIHDELVFEVPEKELKETIDLIKDTMENVYALAVPLKVNIKKGKNWLEMESV